LAGYSDFAGCIDPEYEPLVRCSIEGTVQLVALRIETAGW